MGAPPQAGHLKLAVADLPQPRRLTAVADRTRHRTAVEAGVPTEVAAMAVHTAGIDNGPIGAEG